MKYVIPDVKVAAGDNCLFSSLKHALQKSHLSLSETDIYFLGNGINYVYYKSNESFKFKWKNNEILENIGQLSGFDVCYSFDVSDCVFEQAYEAIREGIIVVLYMYSHSLTYSDIYTKNENREHAIICYGYDMGNRSLYIGDSHFTNYSGEVFTYTGSLEMESARKGAWGIVWFKIDPAYHIQRTEIVTLAVDRIKEFISNAGKDSDGYFRGITALKAFFEDFDKLVYLENDELKATISEIYYGLRQGNIIHKLICLKRFIEENSMYFPGKSDAFGNSLGNMREEWRKLLFDIYKSGVSLKRSKIPEIKDNAFKLIANFGGLLDSIVNTWTA